MGWPAVEGYENGESVNKEVLNRPLNQLAQRTEYLRSLIRENDRTKVTVKASFVGGTPPPGTPVYCTTTDGKFSVASAEVGQNQWFYGSEEAMAVGVVGNTHDGDTYVVLYGKVDFVTEDRPNGILASDLIASPYVPKGEDSPAKPVTGRYYLAPEADGGKGKLTSRPNGPVIYVCTCVIEGDYVKSMLVNPQYRDTGESHVHREIVLSGLPVGGKASRSRASDDAPWEYRSAECIFPDGADSGTGLTVAGVWRGRDATTYVVEALSASTLKWTAGAASGTVELDSADVTASVRIGPEDDVNGRVYVSLDRAPTVGEKWTLVLPRDGRAWLWRRDGGFVMNLGFYGDTGLVPAVPNNAAAFVVDGLELRSVRYGDDRQWEFETTDLPGVWIRWVGDSASGDGLATPFRNNAWTAEEDGEKTVTTRFLSFHTNRMMVGPTGFVTSLQVEPGSPLRITDALSGASALQGALMLGLSVDFETVDRGVSGSEVVKRITGSKFETGPVVERISGGPGVDVFPASGQGIVKVSIGNAHFSGDFETIALKNAKQDLVSGIFPYTKLLGWSDGSGNVRSGFTAKFRVPDYIPYGEYRVVVSASVFGEEPAEDATAAFSLRGYAMDDYSLADEKQTAVAGIRNGKQGYVPVAFPAGYSAFDPVLVHGMPGIPDIAGQRQHVGDLLLKDEHDADLKVRPGCFVAVDVARRGLVGGSAVAYQAPIGFLSLRWNLIA